MKQFKDFKELIAKFGLQKSNKFMQFGTYEASINVIEFLQMIEPHTFLDKRFQRLGGVEYESGWNLEGSRKYASSFIAGGTGNDIILLYIPLALENEQDNEVPCLDTISYYNKFLEEGILFLILEGNNSCSTVKAVYNQNDSIFFNYGTQLKVYYEDLIEQGIQRVFDDKNLPVLFFTNINRKQISEIFKAVNDGVPLSAQEKRGATLSNFSNEYVDFFNHDINLQSFKTDAKDHHALVSQFYMKKESGYATDTGTSALNTRYKEERYDNNYLNKVDANLANLKKGLSQYYAEKEESEPNFCPDKNKLSVKKSDFGSLYLFFDLISSQFRIKDHSSLLKIYFDIDHSLAKIEDKMTVEEAKECGISKLKGNWWRAKGAFLVELFNETINKPNTLGERSYVQYMLDEGIVKEIRGKSSIFRSSLKTALIELQDYRDREGNEIKPVDLHLKNYYHIDHVKPHSQGGKTSIENAEIMKSHDNLSKGSKDNEPYFEHQKVSGE